MSNELKLPKELYHYTSWETFQKIVENHTWRFSSINGTNDLSEDLNLYVKQLLNDRNLISNINSQAKEDIMHHIDVDNFYSFKNYFIACFSAEYDDLGQWRVSYGNYGQGVCIGINPTFFTNHMYLEDKDMLGWTKIAYTPQEQKELLKEVTGKLEYYDNNWIPDNTLELAHELRDIAMIMKHRAFHIENEYRLIVAMIDDEILDYNFCSLQKVKNYNPNIQNEYIVKYIDYDLDSYARVGKGELFKSILLGKDCQMTPNDVKTLLRKNRFDYSKIHISKSDIPYRFSDDRKNNKFLKENNF